MSIGDFISKIGPFFAISSFAWFCALSFLAFSIFETGEHGLKMVHALHPSEPGDVLFRHHKEWAKRILWGGIASFFLTRAVTYTANVELPGGWMQEFLWVHVAVGVVCVVIFLLALTLLSGVKHPQIHHWIVLPGLGAFFLFVFPSGIWLYYEIFLQVLARANHL